MFAHLSDDRRPHGHTVQSYDHREETCPIPAASSSSSEGGGSSRPAAPGLEGRIRDTRWRSPAPHPGRDRQARLELHHPSPRPRGDRASCLRSIALRCTASRRSRGAARPRCRTSGARMMVLPHRLCTAGALGLLSRRALVAAARLIPPQPRASTSRRRGAVRHLAQVMRRRHARRGGSR